MGYQLILGSDQHLQSRQRHRLDFAHFLELISSLSRPPLLNLELNP